MPTPPTRSPYFARLSLLLLVLSLVAFSDNLFTNIGQPSNRDPKFIIHGLFGLAWYGLLAVQATLAHRRHLTLHRRLGLTTFLIALGLTLSTAYLFGVLWKGWAQMATEVRANRLLLPGFALALLLAWRWRQRPEWHKRLIVVGSFQMLGPVLSRCYDPLIVSWMEPLFPAFSARVGEAGFLLFFWVSWLSFFASLVLHDLRRLRRLHPVTVSGLAWWAFAWCLSALT